MEYVKYDNTDITSDIKQPNENLLINSDFKSGIINQKGQTIYTGNTSKLTYTIDMWYIGKSTQSKLTVNSGYITTIMPSNQGIGCWISASKFKNADSVTIAVKLRNQNVKIFSNYKFNSDLTLQTNVIMGCKQFNQTEGYNDYNFYIVNSGTTSVSLDIEFIKIEQGNYFTGMPVYNIEDEIIKCWANQVVLASPIGAFETPIGNASVYNQVIYMTIPFTNYFTKTPSVSLIRGECHVILDGYDSTKITNIQFINFGNHMVLLKGSLEKSMYEYNGKSARVILNNSGAICFDCNTY